MSKYSVASSAIDSAIETGKAAGIDAGDQLLAMLVTIVEQYQQVAGPEEARKAIRYELDNLSGTTDTAFLRSR